jgi:hypothetical protein
MMLGLTSGKSCRIWEAVTPRVVVVVVVVDILGRVIVGELRWMAEMEREEVNSDLV